MKFLGYCLLCLFATRVQPKAQITKLFPVEGLAAYHKQFNSTTKSVDKFWDKLRTTYNLVFHQPNNSNIEKISAKNASNSNLQALRLIWADTLKVDNYTNLKYPNTSFLDQVKSLSTLKNDSKYSSSLKKDSTVEVKTTIGTNKNKVSSTSFSKKNSDKARILSDDDWFNDIQPLEQLELQDEELDKKNEVEIVTPKTTLQLPTMSRLLEWLGSLFGFTYSIYAKLSGAPSVKEKTTN